MAPQLPGVPKSSNLDPIYDRYDKDGDGVFSAEELDKMPDGMAAESMVRAAEEGKLSFDDMSRVMSGLRNRDRIAAISWVKYFDLRSGPDFIKVFRYTKLMETFGHPVAQGRVRDCLTMQAWKQDGTLDRIMDLKNQAGSSVKEYGEKLERASDILEKAIAGCGCAEDPMWLKFTKKYGIEKDVGFENRFYEGTSEQVRQILDSLRPSQGQNPVEFQKDKEALLRMKLEFDQAEKDLAQHIEKHPKLAVLLKAVASLNSQLSMLKIGKSEIASLSKDLIDSKIEAARKSVD